MKAFFLRLCLFICFGLITYALLLFYWVKYDFNFLKPNVNYRIGSYGHMHSRMQEIKLIKDVDILFLGSSHAYRGFDTRFFNQHGLKTFNMGSSFQTPIQTKVLLNRYLDSLNPKLIIYEVYPYTFCADGIESSLDLIANDQNDIFSVSMALKQSHLKTTNTLFYAVTKNIFEPDTVFKEPRKRGYDTYVSGGFVEKSSNYQKEIKTEKNTKWEFNDSQFRNFENIVNLFNEKQIPFLLVMAPMSEKYYKAFSNNVEFESKIKNYGEYYNFNNLSQLTNEKLYYDKDHLNQKGVLIFNKEIMKIIPKRFL